MSRGCLKAPVLTIFGLGYTCLIYSEEGSNIMLIITTGCHS